MKSKKNRNKIIIIIFLLTIISPSFSVIKFSVAETQSFQNVSVETAHEMINNPNKYPNLVILDVRTESEYNSGHLVDAIVIPVDVLESRIGELNNYKNTEIIVYCRSGSRSEQASEILVEQGFTKVYNLLGGITAWTNVGYPVESGESETNTDTSFNTYILIIGLIIIVCTLIIPIYIMQKKRISHDNNKK